MKILIMTNKNFLMIYQNFLMINPLETNNLLDFNRINELKTEKIRFLFIKYIFPSYMHFILNQN